MSNNSFIDDIYNDYDFDRYLDKIQDFVEDSCEFVCSSCGCMCSPTTIDDSYGYEYGSISSTHKDVYVVSDCCEAPIVNMRFK